MRAGFVCLDLCIGLKELVITFQQLFLPQLMVRATFFLRV